MNSSSGQGGSNDKNSKKNDYPGTSKSNEFKKKTKQEDEEKLRLLNELKKMNKETQKCIKSKEEKLQNLKK